MNQTVIVDKLELLERIRHDCVTFFAFYLREELTLDVPEFHIEIWDELLEVLAQVNHPDNVVAVLQKLFAVPREHSKSTIAKLAFVLFLRYSVLSFGLYVSKTNTVAMQALKDVVAWFKSPQETELYGQAVVEKSNETESLWILHIGIPFQREKKRIVLKAIGGGQQVRGTLIDNKRPEFVVVDDIEDLDTADGGIQQKKLDEWVMGSLLKALSKRGVVIFIGNMIRSTTLLARLSKDPEWNPTVFGALVRDKFTGALQALWEGRWSVESLLKDYRKYRKLGTGHVWEAEMMNLSADKLLQMNLDEAIIIPDVNPEDVIDGFICLDPAFGKNAWNDESAITVHVHIRGFGLPVLVDSRRGRWSETEVLSELIELSYYWNLATWAIEAIAAQRLLIPLFRLLLMERQIPPEVFTMLAIQSGIEAKSSRITAYRQAVAMKSYALTEGQVDVKLLLEEYSPDSKNHDDLCDSASYGTIVWDAFGEVVVSQGVQSIAGRLLQVANLKSKNVGELDVCLF